MEKYIPEELIHKYRSGLCSEEEEALVESWHLKDLEESQHIPSKEDILIVSERMWNGISLHAGFSKDDLTQKKLWPRIALTASALLILSISLYLYVNKETVYFVPSSPVPKDIAPGGNKAFLTLNDGKRIQLDDGTNELVAIQGNTSIHKTIDGKLIYQQYSKTTDLPTGTNKLEIPRGGKYQVVLPDGTRVWLNSATIFSYPTKFDKKDRKVFLQGEAYFEVVRDQFRPFKIISGSQTVEVLGTHFNIKAYPDENEIQTTLLEGKVKLSKELENKILRPGQVALTHANSRIIDIQEANVEKNMAWKNNEFIFNGDDLQSIMKIVARWYNVEVIYEGNPGETKYWGVISQSKNISDVLRMLQTTGKISFKIQGRRITLMN